LPIYPEFVKQFAEQAAAHSDLLAQRLNAGADAAGYSRRAA